MQYHDISSNPFRRGLLTCTIVFSLLLMLCAPGCSGGGGGNSGSSADNNDHIDNNDPVENYDEIREYEGQSLSSINDFRENSISGTQNVDKDTYELKITGLVDKPTAYSYDYILENFDSHTEVLSLHCVEGWSVKLLWEGVLVSDVVQEAEPLAGATTVIFYAYDGYSTSFPIEYVSRHNAILAYKMNDVILPPERGFPFQFVAEDKWGYKWCKWVTEIEFTGNEGYLGYWESRGYPNDASLTDCSPGPVSAQPAGHPDRADCCSCHGAD